MTDKIIVDIEVKNRKIIASKTNDQSFPMPNSKRGMFQFFDSENPSRFNNQVYGSLKRRAFNKARRIVDKYGAINRNGLYGSITIDESDFVPWVKENE